MDSIDIALAKWEEFQQETIGKIQECLGSKGSLCDLYYSLEFMDDSISDEDFNELVIKAIKELK